MKFHKSHASKIPTPPPKKLSPSLTPSSKKVVLGEESKPDNVSSRTLSMLHPELSLFINFSLCLIKKKKVKQFDLHFTMVTFILSFPGNCTINMQNLDNHIDMLFQQHSNKIS